MTQQALEEQHGATGSERAGQTRQALRFVILLGIVSLFADMAYEGARSIAGPYLDMLGASATVVGVTAGLGELLGYALRIVAGYISDRTARYWTITITGYTINMAVVPMLALVGHWQWAVLLLIAERIGKAVRTPSRDAMLSYATSQVGRGWGFGIHEALDQTGAVLGPVLVVAAMWLGDGYRTGFAVLAIPALCTLGVLIAVRFWHPHPGAFEAAEPLVTHGWPTAFWVYLAGSALVGAGFADFALIAYHLAHDAVVRDALIPVYYAVAMGIDAIGALVLGRLFDRFSYPVVAAAVVLALPFAPLVFLGGPVAALIGVTLWGIGLASQESIMRAAVAELIATPRRAAAYGLFNGGYGIAWFAGSAVMGLLYDRSIGTVVAFAVLTQAVAVPVLLAVRRQR
ncbi:MAG: MFS transporter [Chloroflexota bacterium]